MKHYQLILAAALVALAACNKGKVDNLNTASDNEIGFNAVASMNTKANGAIISGTSYATDNTFQVWGWQSQKGDFSEFVDDAASNFMSNLTISYTKGADATHHELAWRNAVHYYYWPFTGKISFLAIHPSTVAPSTTGWNATTDIPEATFANYTITPSSNETVDLMFATNFGSRETVAAVGTGKMNMVFKHALSQIVFYVKTNDNYTADLQFDVESVSINGIDLSGDVAFGNNSISWEDNKNQVQNWNYYNTVKTDIRNWDLSVAEQRTAALYGNAKVMIPQPANVTNPATDDVTKTTITIGYSMQQKPLESNAKITGAITVDAPWTKVKEGDTVHDSAVAISGWEPGKKYNYILNFKLNEILFDPEVTDWVEVEMTTTTIYE